MTARRQIGHDGTMAGLLDRVMYDETQAARLLNVPPSTLHWWLEGRDHHRPVLRTDPTGGRELTWGEFVEARYVAAYRRMHGVKLQDIREFVEELRAETGMRYPLATQQPWIGPGRRLLLDAQAHTKLDPDLWSAYEPASGQVLLTAPAQSFLNVVVFDDVKDIDVKDITVARRLRPAGPGSPVVIDPDLRGGLASVKGIATSVIDELVGAGDSVEGVSEDFGLELDLTIAALDYERTLRLAA